MQNLRSDCWLQITHLNVVGLVVDSYSWEQDTALPDCSDFTWNMTFKDKKHWKRGEKEKKKKKKKKKRKRRKWRELG